MCSVISFNEYLHRHFKSQNRVHKLVIHRLCGLITILGEDTGTACVVRTVQHLWQKFHFT